MWFLAASEWSSQNTKKKCRTPHLFTSDLCNTTTFSWIPKWRPGLRTNLSIQFFLSKFLSSLHIDSHALRFGSQCCVRSRTRIADAVGRGRVKDRLMPLKRFGEILSKRFKEGKSLLHTPSPTSPTSRRHQKSSIRYFDLFLHFQIIRRFLRSKLQVYHPFPSWEHTHIRAISAKRSNQKQLSSSPTPALKTPRFLAYHPIDLDASECYAITQDLHRCDPATQDKHRPGDDGDVLWRCKSRDSWVSWRDPSLSYAAKALKSSLPNDSDPTQQC